ncbi:MAG: YiiX/YebB-like N1pC/P60 family cysteine hydrolase [Phycisphaerales bacterium]
MRELKQQSSDQIEERDSDRIMGAARSLRSLAPLLAGDHGLLREQVHARRAGTRGYFTPVENEHLRERYTNYLTARAGLLETIAELRPLTEDAHAVAMADPVARHSAFLIAYTAACLLVRAGRFLVDVSRDSSTIRAKLNEAIPERGVPRNQFAAIYASMTHPRNAWALRKAMQFADAHRDDLTALAAETPDLQHIQAMLASCESAIRLDARRYLKARLRYRWYSWARRNRSAWQQTMFALFEGVGRVVADVRNPLHRDRVSPAIIAEVAQLLQPGDVIITRHDNALSNLFLPGFWPHAALHVGLPGSLSSGERVPAGWTGARRVLEARKDGVLLRELEDTFAVDAFTILRPQLSREQVEAAIGRALVHEGKLYDFEFDFSRADRIVCTEVVYRAFDGIGPIRMQLKKRSGRLTFSAEDVVDLAIPGNGFTAVAVFGIGGRDDLVTGQGATAALAASYQGVRST